MARAQKVTASWAFGLSAQEVTGGRGAKGAGVGRGHRAGPNDERGEIGPCDPGRTSDRTAPVRCEVMGGSRPPDSDPTAEEGRSRSNPRGGGARVLTGAAAAA